MKSETPPRLERESEAMYHARLDDVKLAAHNLRVAHDWSHKREGTAQTHANAEQTEQSPISRLHIAGHIDAEQLEWACEIARVAESIEREVAVKTAEWKLRVDNSGGPHKALVEGVLWVRLQVAYSWWRQRIPHPQRAVLDMLIGDPVSCSAAAARYRMGKKRARYLLIRSLDLWPEAMDFAEATVDRDDIEAIHARLA